MTAQYTPSVSFWGLLLSFMLLAILACRPLEGTVILNGTALIGDPGDQPAFLLVEPVHGELYVLMTTTVQNQFTIFKFRPNFDFRRSYSFFAGQGVPIPGGFNAGTDVGGPPFQDGTWQALGSSYAVLTMMPYPSPRQTLLVQIALTNNTATLNAPSSYVAYENHFLDARLLPIPENPKVTRLNCTLVNPPSLIDLSFNQLTAPYVDQLARVYGINSLSVDLNIGIYPAIEGNNVVVYGDMRGKKADCYAPLKPSKYNPSPIPIQEPPVSTLAPLPFVSQFFQQALPISVATDPVRGFIYVSDQFSNVYIYDRVSHLILAQYSTIGSFVNPIVSMKIDHKNSRLWAVLANSPMGHVVAVDISNPLVDIPQVGSYYLPPTADIMVTLDPWHNRTYLVVQTGNPLSSPLTPSNTTIIVIKDTTIIDELLDIPFLTLNAHADRLNRCLVLVGAALGASSYSLRRYCSVEPFIDTPTIQSSVVSSRSHVLLEDPVDQIPYQPNPETSFLADQMNLAELGEVETPHDLLFIQYMKDGKPNKKKGKAAKQQIPKDATIEVNDLDQVDVVAATKKRVKRPQAAGAMGKLGRKGKAKLQAGVPKAAGGKGPRRPKQNRGKKPDQLIAQQSLPVENALGDEVRLDSEVLE